MDKTLAAEILSRLEKLNTDITGMKVELAEYRGAIRAYRWLMTVGVPALSGLAGFFGVKFGISH